MAAATSQCSGSLGRVRPVQRVRASHNGRIPAHWKEGYGDGGGCKARAPWCEERGPPTSGPHMNKAELLAGLMIMLRVPAFEYEFNGTWLNAAGVMCCPGTSPAGSSLVCWRLRGWDVLQYAGGWCRLSVFRLLADTSVLWALWIYQSLFFWAASSSCSRLAGYSIRRGASLSRTVAAPSDKNMVTAEVIIVLSW